MMSVFLQTPLPAMLDSVHGRVPDTPLRMFAVECLRRIWEKREGDLDTESILYAEEFAADFGRQLFWNGDGHFATTKLSVEPTKIFDENPQLRALISRHEELDQSEPEILGVLRQEFATPRFAARQTISMRFDFFKIAAFQAAQIETCPCDYWLPDYYAPFIDTDDRIEFSGTIGETWGSRFEKIIPEYCELFEQIVLSHLRSGKGVRPLK